MSIKTHLDALHIKHAELEKKLKDAYTHHQSTALIKKEKLKVKDEIMQYEKKMPSHQKIAA